MHCPDCPPTRQLNHRHERLFDALLDWSRVVEIFPARVMKPMERAALALFFFVVRGIGLLREGDIKENDHMQQKTRLVVTEAHRRGYGITRYYAWQRPTNFFVLRAGAKVVPFEGLPGLHPAMTFPEIDDKEEAKSLLRRLGAPFARGGAFFRLAPAVVFARTLGYPLVVKPRQGSLSAHTTVNIQNEEELRRAIRVAQALRPRFIVEEFIPGSLYRATMVGNRLIACGRWQPPAVVGDGVHTIAELFARGEAARRNILVSLGHDKDSIPSVSIAQFGIDGTRVPAADEVCVIAWKVNVAYGSKMTDVTDDVQEENENLFERIAEAAGLPVLGIDFIAPDIRVAWQEQRCAVIELNSMPGIDSHYPPIGEGLKANIAGALLDKVAEMR